MPLMLDNAGRFLSEESGCHRFDVCQKPDAPKKVFLYEIYTDAAAFDIHKAMPRYLEFSKTLNPW